MVGFEEGLFEEDVLEEREREVEGGGEGGEQGEGLVVEGEGLEERGFVEVVGGAPRGESVRSKCLLFKELEDTKKREEVTLFISKLFQLHPLKFLSFVSFHLFCILVFLLFIILLLHSIFIET